MILFNRTVIVTVGKPGFALGSKEFKVRARGQVEKTDDFFANKAVIELLNLSPDSQRFVESPGMAVRVDVGYGGDTGMLFLGDISKVLNKKDKAEDVCRIEAGDGERSLSDSHVDISLGPGSTNRQAFQRIKDALGMTSTAMTEFREIKYNRGYHFSGQARKAMNQILRDVGYTWSVQNGEIQVVPENESTGEVAVVLQASTGLLEYPQKGTSTESDDAGYDWSFKSLLNKEIIPGRLVNLVSPICGSAWIRVSRAVFDFDSQEGDFSTTAEGFLVPKR